MLDVKNNIDTVNYIIQDSISGILTKKIEIKNNLYIGDGFGVDLSKLKKNKMHLRIRNKTNSNICRIYITDKDLHVRYSNNFLFRYIPKDGKFECSLIDEPFDLDDLSSVFFTESTMISFDREIIFDYNVMIDTLEMCRGLYEKFNQFFLEQSD